MPWQKTALLVFSALALRVGKNQICCLCGWLFLNAAQRTMVNHGYGQ